MDSGRILPRPPTLFTDQPNVFDVSEVLGLAIGLPPAIVTAAVTGAPLYELGGANLGTKILI